MRKFGLFIALCILGLMIFILGSTSGNEVSSVPQPDQTTITMVNQHPDQKSINAVFIDLNSDNTIDDSVISDRIAYSKERIINLGNSDSEIYIYVQDKEKKDWRVKNGTQEKSFCKTRDKLKFSVQEQCQENQKEIKLRAVSNLPNKINFNDTNFELFSEF